jgi:hypothetical protein
MLHLKSRFSVGSLCRPILFALLAAVLTLTPAHAQPDQPNEVFGGISYLRSNLGNGFESSNQAGWHFNFSRWVSDRFALMGDASGHYGTAAYPEIAEIGSADVSIHQILAGPKARIYSRENWTVTGHLLLGISRSRASAGRPFQQSPFEFTASDTDFAATLGGALDYRVTDRISVRVIQPDVYLGGQPDVRLSAGIVIHFGE